MGFFEFPFFWPVLVSGCLQIEFLACFDGNKQENYKSCYVCFGPTHIRNLSTAKSEAESTSHQNETKYLDL